MLQRAVFSQKSLTLVELDILCLIRRKISFLTHTKICSGDHHSRVNHFKVQAFKDVVIHAVHLFEV